MRNITRIVFLFSFLFLLVFVTAVKSQSSTSENNSSSSISFSSTSISNTSSQTGNTTNYFHIELERKTQDIFSKTVPIEIRITSEIDAKRFEISWVYNQKNLKLTNNYESFTSIKKDETKTFTYYFTPLKKSENKVLIQVQAWQNDYNYPEIEDLDLRFDDNLEIIPQTDEYKNNQRIWQAVSTVIGLLVIVSIIIVLVKLIIRFQEWYRKD